MPTTQQAGDAPAAAGGDAHERPAPDPHPHARPATGPDAPAAGRPDPCAAPRTDADADGGGRPVACAVVPAWTLAAVWRAYARRTVGLADVRAWFALRVAQSRAEGYSRSRRPRSRRRHSDAARGRETAADGKGGRAGTVRPADPLDGLPFGLVSAVGRLLPDAPEAVAARLRRLARAGLARGSGGRWRADVSVAPGGPLDAAGWGLLPALGVSPHRRIPVPLDLLRAGARSLTRGELAAIVACCLRCCWLRRTGERPGGSGGGVGPGGRRGSWDVDRGGRVLSGAAAAALGTCERTLRAGRRKLEAAGVVRVVPTPQRTVNRHGLRLVVGGERRGRGGPGTGPAAPADEIGAGREAAGGSGESAASICATCGGCFTGPSRPDARRFAGPDQTNCSARRSSEDQVRAAGVGPDRRDRPPADPARPAHDRHRLGVGGRMSRSSEAAEPRPERRGDHQGERDGRACAPTDRAGRATRRRGGPHGPGRPAGWVLVADDSAGPRRPVGPIAPADLSDPGRLLDLRDRLIAAGELSPSESDRVNFAGAAARALARGRNPGGMLRWIVRNRRWDHVTQADEDAGLRRLRAAADGGEGDREDARTGGGATPPPTARPRVASPVGTSRTDVPRRAAPRPPVDPPTAATDPAGGDAVTLAWAEGLALMGRGVDAADVLRRRRGWSDGRIAAAVASSSPVVGRVA